MANGRLSADFSIFWDRIDNLIDGFIKVLPSLILGVGVFVVIALLSGVVESILRKGLSGKHANLGEVMGRLARWAILFVGLLVSVAIVAPSVTPAKLLSTLGIGGVAIGFAFKDILQNFLAGILLLLRQPFEVGDQIIYKGFEGTVEEIETRSTLLKTYDGRRVVIPNGEIYTNAVVVNTAFSQRRYQYDVGIGYGDDIDHAIKEIQKVLESTEGVLQEPAPEVFVEELAGSSVNLRMRWWSAPKRSNAVKVASDIKRKVKHALDNAAIDMPYPTQVMLFHDQTESVDGDRSSQREGWPSGDENPTPQKISDVHRRSDS